MDPVWAALATWALAEQFAVAVDAIPTDPGLAPAPDNRRLNPRSRH